MPDSYAALYYHIVFGTKQRESWISRDFEQQIWNYVGGIAGKNGMTPLGIGGLEDHLHVVVAVPPTLAVSRAVQMLKGGSSRWIRSTFPGFGAFGWQDGYGAFTVSKSQLPATLNYVENQRVRHETLTFGQEYRAFLDRHGVSYDAHYLLE
jgi:putative transposase